LLEDHWIRESKLVPVRGWVTGDEWCLEWCSLKSGPRCRARWAHRKAGSETATWRSRATAHPRGSHTRRSLVDGNSALLVTMAPSRVCMITRLSLHTHREKIIEGKYIFQDNSKIYLVLLSSKIFCLRKISSYLQNNWRKNPTHADVCSMGREP
jgi:hypothetical protein